MSMRAVPGDAAAPIIVHLVDWREAPSSFTLGIRPELTNGVARAGLILPGAAPRELHVDRSEDGWAILEVETLNPYTVLVPHPAPGPGEKTK